MNKYESPILIVSAPRSGSSLLSYVLNAEGVYVGTTKNGDSFNQNGYFENVKVTKLLIKYLRKNDTDNLQRKYQPINLDTDLPNFNRRIYRILKRDGFKKSQKYLFKEPKIALTWKLWHKYYPNAKWILLNRKEENILNSYERAEFMDMYENKNDWSEYLKRFQSNMQNIENECTNVLKINIEDIYNGNEEVINELFKFVDIENTGAYKKCIDKKLLKV